MMVRSWLLISLGLLAIWSVTSQPPEDETEESKDEEETPVSKPSSNGKNLTEIIEESLSLITRKSKDPVELRLFLNKHYFTGEKDLSIWPKAIEETEKLYGMDFSERDLADMQRVLRNIYKNMLECDEKLRDSKRKKDDLKKHSKCYEVVYNIIASGDVQFGLPTGTDVGQARMLSLNIAFNLMRLLYLQMTQNLSIKAGENPLEMTKPIIDTAVQLTSFYGQAEQSANITRMSAVSSIQVCTRVTIFFKDFDDHCSPSPIPYGQLQIAGGSTSGMFQRKVKVTVTDNVTGKDVCDLTEKTSDKITREVLTNNLKAKCEKIRASYMKDLTKEMKNYFKNRTSQVIKSLPLLWGKSKKKLKVFSQKIGLNIQSKASQ